jgi:hypothetical protein
MGEMTEPLDYPPPPWRLRGALQAGVFVAPAQSLPPLGSADLRPVKFLERALICLVWAQYASGGDLIYNEALAAVLVRHPRGWAFSIPQIWVDDPHAAAGGRQLWAIPKDIGRFSQTDGQCCSRMLEVAGACTSIFASRPWLRFPGRWRMPLRLVQSGTSSLQPTRGEARGHLALLEGQWRFSPDGPLGWMARATLIASGELEGATMIFGAVWLTAAANMPPAMRLVCSAYVLGHVK